MRVSCAAALQGVNLVKIKWDLFRIGLAALSRRPLAKPPIRCNQMHFV